MKIRHLAYLSLVGLLMLTANACKSRKKFSESQKPVTEVNHRTEVNTVKYIARFKKIAKEEMKQYGIPASITLAQGILESSSGTSWLARTANNHFGIKCGGEWYGPHVLKTDDHVNECFRKYKNPEQSFRDHSEFLAKKRRYAFLFRLPRTDYEAWAKGLKSAGYATDPSYPQKLIYLIEKYKLDQYDKEVLNEMNIKPRDEETTAQHQSKGKKIIYEVKAGETLFTISKKFNIPVKDIKELNNLVDFDIYEGQILVLKVDEDQETDITETPGDNQATDEAESDRTEKTSETEAQNNLETPPVKQEAVEAVNNIAQNVPENTRQSEQTIPSTDSDNYIVHTVQPKETLYRISAQYGVSIEDIKKVNGLTSNNLQTGQQLKIPAKINASANNPAKLQETENPSIPEYHIVRPGETLYRIHVMYKVSIKKLRELNGLENNTIHVGQKIKLR